MDWEDLPKDRREYLERCLKEKEERFAQQALFKYQSGIVIAASRGEQALIERPVKFDFFKPGTGTSWK